MRRLSRTTGIHLRLSELRATVDAAGKYERMVILTACDA
jgi:hypothetical protein